MWAPICKSMTVEPLRQITFYFVSYTWEHPGNIFIPVILMEILEILFGKFNWLLTSTPTFFFFFLSVSSEEYLLLGRGPELGSHMCMVANNQLHSSSPRGSRPLMASMGTAFTWCTNINTGKTSIHRKINKSSQVERHIPLIPALTRQSRGSQIFVSSRPTFSTRGDPG